jgi:hypothetical protein
MHHHNTIDSQHNKMFSGSIAPFYVANYEDFEAEVNGAIDEIWLTDLLYQYYQPMITNSMHSSDILSHNPDAWPHYSNMWSDNTYLCFDLDSLDLHFLFEEFDLIEPTHVEWFSEHDRIGIIDDADVMGNREKFKKYFFTPYDPWNFFDSTKSTYGKYAFIMYDPKDASDKGYCRYLEVGGSCDHGRIIDFEWCSKSSIRSIQNKCYRFKYWDDEDQFLKYIKSLSDRIKRSD